MIGEVPRRGGPDYFLSNPPRQPKKEIGDYVESHGILVPRRFTTLHEAIASGKPFLMRSEHPQDYAGASDLFPTIKINQGILDRSKRLNEGYQEEDAGYHRGDASLTDPELFFRLLADFQKGTITQDQFESGVALIHSDKALRYCSLLGIPSAEFISQTSFSYWEVIPGFNRSIIADSAIPNRYHIVMTTDNPLDPNATAGYTIVEDGKIVQTQTWHLPPELQETVSSLITLYESVRGMDRFNKNHCAIMEVQTSDSDNYFLQYHRATDFRPSTFILDKPPEEGEIEANFVRGATPKEGLVLEMNMHTDYDREFPVKEEEAGYDFTHYLYREIMVRRRTLQIVKGDNFWTIAAFLAAKPHLTISELFKSPICVAVGTEHGDKWVDRFADPELTPEEDRRKYSIPIRKFRIRVVSDGKKAYIKLLE